MLIIYSIVLVDIVAGSVMWPVWPQFVKGYDRPELLLAVGTAIFIGLQLLTAPLLGNFSDVKGRKPIFIITAIGTFFSNLLLIPRNVFAYFSNRGADGLTNGVYAAVRSSIADISDEKDLLRNMGLEGTIVSMGFILGPLIASAILLVFDVVGDHVAPTLLYTGISISLINIILSFLFKETLHRKVKNSSLDWRNVLKESLSPIKHFKRIVILDRSRAGLLNTVLLQICLTLSLGYYNYLITYISLGELQMNPKQISYFFTYFGVIFLVISYVFYSYVIEKIHPTQFLVWMSIIGMVTHMGYALIESSQLALYIIVTLDCLTIGLLPGLMDGLIGRYTESDDRGEIFGITQALNGLSSFITTIIFGALSVISLQLPFYWFAVCLVPLLFANQLLNKTENEKVSIPQPDMAK